MLKAARILAEVATFRLRRLEMANLAGSLALVVVLRLEPADAAVRLGVAAGVNLVAYATNDYLDREQDLATGRDPRRTSFLVAHHREAKSGILTLLAVLVVVSWLHDPWMLVGVLSGSGLCLWYSARLKRIAIVDVLAMAVWGALMSLVAVPFSSTAGLLLLVELGLFSAAFELVQVLRDRADDAARDVRTTAVVFGEAKTRRFLRVVLASGFLWALLALDARTSPLFLVPLALPLAGREAERYWTQLRFALGGAWLVLLASVGLRSSLGGILVGLPLR